MIVGRQLVGSLALAVGLALAACCARADDSPIVKSCVTNGLTLYWFEEMVPMADGTRLYTYGVLPPPGEKKCIIVERSIYVKEERRNMPQYCLEEMGRMWRRGYCYVRQHVRGAGMSEGDCIPELQERADGLATLAWIRKLPHYNGELFLRGASYLSSVHYSYLNTNPPDVKGAYLEVQVDDRYKVKYRNGQFKNGLDGDWYVANYKKKDKSLRRNPAAKFTDLPLAGFTRRRFGEYDSFFEAPFEHPRPEDKWWQTYGVAGGEYRRAFADSTMPVLLVTGLYDIYTEGVFDMWREATPERRANCALYVDTFDHGGGAARMKDRDRMMFMLDWFDYCRGKGQPTFVKPGETCWQELWSNEWHFAPEMTDAPVLETRTLGETAKTFVYDPKKTPDFPGAGCLTFGGMRAQHEPDFDTGVVSFVLPPESCDRHVRGRMKLHLAVTSDCDDTAFYVRVSQKRPDGKWWTLRDDIKTIAWEHPSYVPGSEVALDFTLSDHAFLLAKGDQLRVDVAGGNAKAFVPHTNCKGPFHLQERCRVAHNTVIGGKSTLTLPVEE